MSEQTPFEKSAVVGEDGELIQADTTVDPDVYSEYVATYVRRDPLIVRMQEHFRGYGCAYVFFAPWIVLLIFGVLLDILSNGSKEVTKFLVSFTQPLPITLIVCMGIIYIIFKVARFFRSD